MTGTLRGQIWGGSGRNGRGKPTGMIWHNANKIYPQQKNCRGYKMLNWRGPSLLDHGPTTWWTQTMPTGEHTGKCIINKMFTGYYVTGRKSPLNETCRGIWKSYEADTLQTAYYKCILVQIATMITLVNAWNAAKEEPYRDTPLGNENALLCCTHPSLLSCPALSCLE